VGTLSLSSWDAAALLNVLSGHESEDLTTVTAPVPDYVSELSNPPEGFRIGVPRVYFQEDGDPAVLSLFDQFLDRATTVGCEPVDLELEGIEKIQSCWRTIRLSEATAFHSRWLENSPELYGADVLALLNEGVRISAVDYVNAQNLRPGLMQGFAHSMENVDVIATPTTSITAPELGQAKVAIGAKEVEVRSALTQNTLPFNVVGFPAVSFPVGFCNGLPVGVQLASCPFEEAKLLRLSFALEDRYEFPLVHRDTFTE
jgi:aspartyl-tRNA(Asn)/glutamyl-tRNA(Gln) amidotransferase subunit A